MSHPNNDQFLESAKERFESADTEFERIEIVRQLREEGFGQQADALAPFIKSGVVADDEEKDTDYS